MRVLGPRGTLQLTHHLQEAFSADIAIRMADENLPAYASMPTSSGVTASSTIKTDCELPALRSITATRSSRPSFIADATRQDYDGAFVVGEYLMAFCP